MLSKPLPPHETLMQNNAAHPCPTTHPRGVFELGAVSAAGEVILMAVNGRGQRIAERHVGPAENLEDVWDEMEALLERADPRPTLALIRAG